MSYRSLVNLTAKSTESALCVNFTPILTLRCPGVDPVPQALCCGSVTRSLSMFYYISHNNRENEEIVEIKKSWTASNSFLTAFPLK